MKHLLSMADLEKDELFEILKLAEKLKEERYKGVVTDYLKNKSLAMIFELPSTRTRVSFEVAMTDLGGHALYLGWDELQLGRGEPIKDTARVLSRYVHAVMMRVREHSTIEEFARYSTVPVINGLSNLEHPCQVIADLLTIYEYRGDFKDVTLAWVGDGNNVCNSMILAAALTGMKMVISTPENYDPNPEIVKKAEEMGAKLRFVRDPKEAVKEADVIYTDVWTSMGQEAEKEARLKAFQPYQVSDELLKFSKDDVVVMHCLPAHRGEEITDEVMEGKHSIVFDQAENRLHAQKAILLKLLGKESEVY
ncbi:MULTISPECIES: ornithine carbamoyltransferase [Archaeoglobus]|jgi:ornithine carbamoyltransferase|uniref:Ornithine carbamoyltransferase n=3 Tax=Archaeoglobus fulgidus TaxID=2234 RepID=OTC_ARCFU|nr:MULTISPECIES: ornithine carbamoyltransferase [Archaeoglobus]O29013.1 RecName: Full=Ornithine carbamoyltransferase; Short=OTCase [Archaeoglobus fulgidus DSM 4304]AAB89987.1 ornithine carbamoyltransferase (argF) [Archaeoglobus fulgidus DSM 4304]AIG98126.1 ornithine carbamoyltransferase [Archaeoglobus fulgidus DSM 8774]KUJ93112.1 MAG: Ornithine carbamoyltransferase [Archaeoglobus fulgidus]KUK06214.1 MAG: Ornithine carbamoyltransferase [Archaeoglobus fulgidus]MDI3498396.1 ornithine carbamoyltr